MLTDANMAIKTCVLPEPPGPARDIKSPSYVKINLFMYVGWEVYYQLQLTKETSLLAFPHNVLCEKVVLPYC